MLEKKNQQRKPRGSNFLYIIVETGTRELHAKILLAKVAAKYGYKVFVGPKGMCWHIGTTLPSGVVLFKDCLSARENLFDKLRRRGNKVCVHDEEGFVYSNDEDYLARRVSVTSLKYVDTFFCWGTHQKNLLEPIVNNLDLDTKLFVVGHPRLDLIQSPYASYTRRLEGTLFESVSVDLDSKVKPIVLINTKLSECNHRDGPSGWLDMLEKYKQYGQKGRAFRKEQVQYKKNLLSQYLVLIKRLAEKLPDHSIVVRPHPSESDRVYKETFSGAKNVFVIKDFPIGYWLSRASVVIHTACTTGIEASIAGVPSINYTPLDGSRFDSPLPQLVSTTLTNHEDVVSAIKNKTLPPPRAETLHAIEDRVQIYSSMTSAELVACELACVAEKIQPSIRNKILENLSNFKIWRVIATRFSKNILNLLSQKMYMRLKMKITDSEKTSFQSLKLSISKNEVNLVSDALTEVSPELGSAKILKYSGHVYLILPK